MAQSKRSKTLPQLLKDAQKVFNQFIRLRDQGKGCISCSSNKVEHASHYFSVGQYSALRFNEMNVQGSCAKCNTFLHGNLIHYRQGLVKRYGEDKVKQLEQSADLRKDTKWDRTTLEFIIQNYKQK